MKYRAKPIEVEAFRIARVGQPAHDDHVLIVTENDRTFLATPGMLARIQPKPGDYVVIQADGYTYLNPREVFERKYSPAKVEPVAIAAPRRPRGIFARLTRALLRPELPKVRP
jgi:hypothetical protein